MTARDEIETAVQCLEQCGTPEDGDVQKALEHLRTALVELERPIDHRRRLPDERQSVTHKFSVANHEGYITVGMYEDGSPGEIFLVAAKKGGTLSGLLDSFAVAISTALQYGVPLKALVGKFSNTRFEPSGYTPNPEIPYAKSFVDYVFKWLGKKFIPPEEAEPIQSVPPLVPDSSSTSVKVETEYDDGPPCTCGTIMQRVQIKGSGFWMCPNCRKSLDG